MKVRLTKVVTDEILEGIGIFGEPSVNEAKKILLGAGLTVEEVSLDGWCKIKGGGWQFPPDWFEIITEDTKMNCKKCVYYLKIGEVGICKLAQLPIKNYEPHFKCPLERELPKIFEGGIKMTLKVGNIKDVSPLWSNGRFELVEEPQVDDVWGSEDKQHIIKIIATFNAYDGEKCYSYLVLKSNRVSKDSASFLPLRFFAEVFPLLLHRPPKKQPKPRPEQPKKQEEVWEPVIAQGVDSTRCFRKGNSIKWIKYGQYEGVATCNKKDKFDLFFGIDLAWHRAEIKYCEAKIADMIKEGANV